MPRRIHPDGVYRESAEANGYSLALAPERGPLHVSGQVGVDRRGELVSDRVADQYRQALTNVKTLVEAAGGTMADVVDTTTYVLDMDAWPKDDVRAIRDEFFEDPYPCSTLVEVGRLAGPGMLVEVSAVAYL